MHQFSSVDLLFIVRATQWTILLSLIAFVFGSIGGLAVALARVSPYRWLRLTAGAYIQVFQGTPLLMQLFLVYFGGALFGVSVPPIVAAGIALTLNSSSVLGEIWRGCIQAVPKGQWEASTALGIRYYSRMRHVILPQAVKISIPPTVGFLVLLIKSTSLTSILGFVELTRAGQIVNNGTARPFLTFGIVALIYFLLCFPLSLYSRHLEKNIKK